MREKKCFTGFWRGILHYHTCMLRILLSAIFFLTPLFAFAETNLSTLQKQWFDTFEITANGADFICKTQCFVILPTLWMSEFLSLKGNFSGKWEVGYGFLNGNQILAGWFSPVNGDIALSKVFNFTDTSFYSQLPKEIPIILIVNGEISWKGFGLTMGQFSPLDRVKSHFETATRYVPFSPRTINFLEWPMWGGEYINKAFYSWIIFLLVLALLWSMFEKKHHVHTKKSILIGFSVLVFFWIFFDAFSTINQVKMYSEFRNAPSFMANGRLAKESDFYGFLDFIRGKVQVRSYGNFIMPYPFDSEGKYHMYPFVKFQDPEKLQYVFTYNPYGKNAPFGFVDPIYDGTGKVLSWKPSETNSYSWNISEVLTFGNFGKIYVIKP